MTKKNSGSYIVLSLISGLLLSLAWPTKGLFPLVFVGFIPLLFVEKYLLNNVKRYSWGLIRYSFVAFLVFNFITCWWIAKVSFAAGIAACMLNAMVMTFVFQIYHVTKVTIYKNHSRGQWILIPVWLGFEYLHYHWELNFPWLNLGNVFATHIKLVQWYDFTGVLGGSLWVLFINVMAFYLLQLLLTVNKNKNKIIICSSVIIAFVLVPLIISLIKYSRYEEVLDPVTVVVVQPNSDPINEKFSLTANEVIDCVFLRTDNLLDNNVNLILGPETALQVNTWEDELPNALYVSRIRAGLKAKAPNAAIILGASTYKRYFEGEEHKPYTKMIKSNNNLLYYDAFNTNLFIDTSQNIGIYHKSKLTPGVEIMPYIKYLKFIEKFALDLGGTVGSLGYNHNQEPFVTHDMKIRTASIICYESIFGEHVSKFINNGANLITISTNDGWWGNTQGHRQHCAYASLLAIETRRSIARSANTGISCTINQKGEISNETKYWVPDTFKAQLNLNTKKTFYVRYGDFIAHFSLIVDVMLAIIAFIYGLVLRKIKY